MVDASGNGELIDLFALPVRADVTLQALHDVTVTLGGDPALATVELVGSPSWYLVKYPADAPLQLASRQPPRRAPKVAKICPECGRILETAGAVEVHLRRDHTDDSVPCPQCGWVYQTEQGMLRHRRKAHPDIVEEEPTRFCGFCQREFATPADARTHEQTLHVPGAVTLECDECSWVFETPRGLSHHQTMKHPPEPEPNPELRVEVASSPPPGPAEPATFTAPVDSPKPEDDEDGEDDEFEPPPPGGPPRLWCSSCGFHSLFADDLNSHCLARHRRRATPLERTPSRDRRQ